MTRAVRSKDDELMIQLSRKVSKLRADIRLLKKESAKQIDHLKEEIEDYKSTFDLQTKRMEAAVKVWRKANNISSDTLFPDLGRLLEWFIKRDALCSDLEAEKKAMASEPIEGGDAH